MKRRHLHHAIAAGWAAGLVPSWVGAASPQPADGGEKVLRYAFPIAETGFDPAQIADIYSRIVTAHIFDSMLTYDHLARPFKLKPLVAEAMPEVSDDFRTFTFKLRKGIYFADDPAFKGRKRELVAEDFVYSFKRIYDPALKSPGQASLEEEGIVGLQELRDAALKSKKPFDYDAPVEGLRALDRYTLRVKLRESRPRHLAVTWAARDILGAVAREAIEAYPDRAMEHPVGTGPFKLADWRRSSRIVLVRNPSYRDDTYDAEPNPGDVEGEALVARFKGRKLPMVDRVEVSVIEQAQPRWLSFLGAEQDLLYGLPNDFVDQAVPGGRIAPTLAKRGVVAFRTPAPDVTLTVYNMDSPVVGGYTPAKVALRRAMVLGDDVMREIRIVRHGQAIPAQTIVPPLTEGYRSDLKTEMGVFDPARAKALLDVYGYADRDGDGWRENPDGSPLVLQLNTQSDQASRQIDELWTKNMTALGLRTVAKVAQWPENLKSARAGTFMIWRVGSTAASPDGQGALERVYGGSIGKGNISRVKLAELDRIYDRMKSLPSGAERQALFDKTAEIVAAYAPYRLGVHRILTDLAYPWVTGYRRPPFWLDWWQMVDVDAAAQRKAIA